MRIVIGNNLTSLLFRFICTVELLVSFPISASTIKVVTFNIRYDSGRDGVNSWLNRKELLQSFLFEQDADIICLQEVLHHQYTYLTDHMESYGVVGNGRNDGQKKGEYAPIFYKKDKYDLIENGLFWLSEYPTKVGSIGWDAKQPRIVTWVKLKKKRTNKTFIVANTHFDDIGKVSRQKSIELITNWMSSFTCPIIFTGDLNDNTESMVYKSLSESPFGLKDADIHAKKHRGVNYTFHNFGTIPVDKRSKIDYVFTSNIKKVKSVEIPREHEHNGIFISDHNPVIAILYL
jgi:endonuclease/exonuclease/phosphatase family metal-dependent hydrolase